MIWRNLEFGQASMVNKRMDVDRKHLDYRFHMAAVMQEQN
jgi:hypothetical protein